VENNNEQQSQIHVHTQKFRQPARENPSVGKPNERDFIQLQEIKYQQQKYNFQQEKTTYRHPKTPPQSSAPSPQQQIKKIPESASICMQ
jgi:hypothetical protein